MLTVEKVSLLAAIDLFAAVPVSVLASLATVMEVRDLSPGDHLVAEGDPGDALFVVVDGTLRIESGGRPLSTSGPGAVIGELALLDPAPRSASAVAVEDTRVLVLDKDDFDLVLADHPQLSEGIIRYLVRFIRAGTASA